MTIRSEQSSAFCHKRRDLGTVSLLTLITVVVDSTYASCPFMTKNPLIIVRF